MKRLIFWLAFGLLAVFIVPSTLAQGGNLWTAEYYNNASLSGSPIVVRSESSPTNEWGYNAPVPGLPADYFSVRWSKTDYVNAGTYEFSLKADDGVRLYVDGVLYINEWHPAAGRFYQTTVTLGAGNHSFVVEYFEATEIAYLLYNFNPVNNVPPGSPQATVTVNFLNLRAQPYATAAKLGVISQGQTYPLVGRNAYNTWLQLNVNGSYGWVNANYVNATNIYAVPVTDGSGGTYVTPTPIPPPPPVGATATVTAYLLNVRNIPNPYTGAVIAQIHRNEVYTVIGRNLDTSWVQINANGYAGWVRSTWVALSNIGGVPVTSNTTNPSAPAPSGSYATVRAYYLNLRSAPYYPAPVLTLIGRGQSYPAIGRNSDSSWVQITVGGLTGWVRSTWVTVTPNIYNLPVTG